MAEAEILLVEDNPDDLELALDAFRRTPQPARLTVARDGVEAIEALFGPGGGKPGGALRFVPRLVLLDLKLPRMDGLEVLQRIKFNAGSRPIPVVILTSSTQERDIAESYRLGANSYIVKPVDFGAFVQTVEALCTYWLIHNRSAGEMARV
jgi:two-component system response regulator